MKFNLPQKLGLLLLAIFPLVALSHGISEEDKQRMLVPHLTVAGSGAEVRRK